MLANVDFQNPLLWAVMIGWILTVVLHEFAHGLAGYLGGDYTIKERGGLTLNPLQYVDPVMSIVLPVVFLAMGGIPLPGGATFIRRDLIRGKLWNSIVSAAGPAMNLLIFLGLCALLHPRVGWVNYAKPVAEWDNARVFVAAMAFLQLFAVILNLIPVPPVDGFGIIAPYLPADLRWKLTTPPTSNMLFIGFFLILWGVPSVNLALHTVIFETLKTLGIPWRPVFAAVLRCFD